MSYHCAMMLLKIQRCIECRLQVACKCKSNWNDSEFHWRLDAAFSTVSDFSSCWFAHSIAALCLKRHCLARSRILLAY
jgi:hypothetical protein